MPSLQGRFFNFYIRRFVRRRFGFDAQKAAEKARRIWGSPKFSQWLHSRNIDVEVVGENGINGEWLATENAGRAVILYIHGGGFISCSAKTHRPISATLARKTNFRVFSLKYRLAPEHPFPAALEDVVAAYRWLTETQKIPPPEIALAGDSAGGNLVLSLLLKLRDEKLPLPACAVCFSPWTDMKGTGESNRTNAELDDMFCAENTDEFSRAYLGDASPENVFASPVLGEFHDLPPVLFHVGSTEMLLDDSKRIHEKIRSVGGASELEIYERIFHCWQMGAGLIPEADDSLKKAAEFIRRHISRI